MRLLAPPLRAVMFAGAIAGLVLSASAARADWHGHDRGWHGDRDWHSHDRDWRHDRNWHGDWHGDRDWRWHGGVFLGVPAPFYVAPPVYLPPPAYY
jgi:hypothetical protein